MTLVRLEPWGEGDLPLLRRLMGDPEMTRYLGGPESERKIARRQTRYEQLDPSTGRMFKVIEDGEPAGSIGFWDKDWRDEMVYEIGWLVLPEFQGRGIATAATADAIALAREEARHRFIHAFPSVENAASNAICRKLGFTFVETHEFEYPKGHWMLCNDWRLDLR